MCRIAHLSFVEIGMMGLRILRKLVRLEEDIRYQEFAALGESEFLYETGKIPVLISAPHGAAHTRHGKYKGEDEYTAGIARLLAEETGAHCIYLRRKSKTDSNVDLDTSYKKKVRQICTANQIRFVLDIHGMWQKHDVGVELGTRDGRSCPEQIEIMIQALSECGFSLGSEDKMYRLRVDNRFSGNGSSTREPMVKFVSEKLEIPAAQIEINAWNRIVRRREDAAERDKDFQGDPEMIKKTILALTHMISMIHKNFTVATEEEKR